MWRWTWGTLGADLCFMLHLWLTSPCSHYLNSRVMLYQTVGRGSHKIPLKQLRIRGPARLSETEIATDAECWERRCGFRGRRPFGGKEMGPFSLPWDQDIPFPGTLLCQETRAERKITCPNCRGANWQVDGKTRAEEWISPIILCLWASFTDVLY